MTIEQILVFDIETVSLPWDEFSESQQEFILRRAETEDEKEQRIAEMSLSPITSQVICIGLQLMQLNMSGNWDELNKAALIIDKDNNDDSSGNGILPSGIKYLQGSEKWMLSYFWKILSKYDKAWLLSFNGRNFDAPYLMLRSALLHIRPSRNLMLGTKYNYPMHIDLLDEFTFYNPSYYGATKRFNFDFYARAFGLDSPKSEGIDGSKVKEFYMEGKIIEIAEYCMRDVTTTWELFLVWNRYLRF